MEREIFLYRSTDSFVEVMVHMDKEMLEKLTKSYNKILESGVRNFECINLVAEIISEAKRRIVMEGLE